MSQILVGTCCQDLGGTSDGVGSQTGGWTGHETSSQNGNGTSSQTPGWLFTWI